MKQFFICGIDTNVGKTIFSAIIVEKLCANYWKPIQTGEDLDTNTVKSLVDNKKSKFFKEAFCFKEPASPHYASELENVFVNENDIQLPNTKRIIVIEGAGGILTPINNNGLTYIELLKKWNVETIIVSKNYLGSINHTLLTYEVLKKNNIIIKGIVFNGKTNQSTEFFIENYTKLPVLLRINDEKEINKFVIKKYSEKLKI